MILFIFSHGIKSFEDFAKDYRDYVDPDCDLIGRAIYDFDENYTESEKFFNLFLVLKGADMIYFINDVVPRLKTEKMVNTENMVKGYAKYNSIPLVEILDADDYIEKFKSIKGEKLK